MAANATFALKAGEWFRRGLLLIEKLLMRWQKRASRQAENPLIALSRFAGPALTFEVTGPINSFQDKKELSFTPSAGPFIPHRRGLGFTESDRPLL